VGKDDRTKQEQMSSDEETGQFEFLDRRRSQTPVSHQISMTGNRAARGKPIPKRPMAQAGGMMGESGSWTAQRTAASGPKQFTISTQTMMNTSHAALSIPQPHKSARRKIILPPPLLDHLHNITNLPKATIDIDSWQWAIQISRAF
jgi:hypothetical protein